MTLPLPRTLIALALVVIATNVAEAQAAAPWTAPTPIPGTPDAFSGLTYAPNGLGLAGWSTGGAAPANDYDVSGVPLTPDGTPGTARKLSSGMLVGFFDSYAPNRLIAVGAKFSTIPRPLWALGRVSGALGRPEPLAGTRRGYAAGLAVNERGDAAVLLRLCPTRTSCSRPLPYLVVRRAGRDFGSPIRLGERGPAYAGAVAINARGDVLAVWDRPLKGSTGRRGIYARFRTAGGRLGATQRLGTSQPIPKISAAIGAGRSAVVGWLGQRISEGRPLSDAQVWVADAQRGRRFGAAQRLETVPNLGAGRYVGQAGVRVALAGGHKVVAWTGYGGERFVVRAAAIEGGEVREPAQIVSDPARNAVLADLEAGDDGEAVVLGLTGLRGSDPEGPAAAVGVIAAVRPAGAAAFGAVETVAEPQDYREDVEAEFVPTTGRIVAVWRDLGSRSLVVASREPAQ